MSLLAGLHYRAGSRHIFNVNLSRKSRFPNLKDRYSYRLGKSLPNPVLMSESSWNADLNYHFAVNEMLKLTGSVFFSQLNHAIQAVYGVDPDNSSVYQFQNTGKARFYGCEAGFEWKPARGLETGLNYSFTRRENLDHPELLFAGLPEHQLDGMLRITLLERFQTGFAGICNSSRISTSDGKYRTDPFFTLDFVNRLFPGERLSLDFSITNMLDKAYSYTEGYPAPGRQYRAALRYQFSAPPKKQP